VEAAHGDLGMIRPGDVVLAISNSGETDELNAILPSLRALGATVIALTGQLDSAMAGLADVVVGVHVPREACPHNLAPTASTTAALAVGDALAVCLINWKDFGEADFLRCHPGGVLGQRLSLPVAQLMHVDNLPLVGPTETVEAALEAMNAGGLGFVGVVDGDSRLAGVFSDGDVRRLLAKGPVLRSLPIAELMTRDPLRVAPGERAGRALDVMESRQITVLPVVDEDRLVGMVHLHDLLGKGRVRFG
jgi:arabinose-5-phosphate isomerase